MNERKLKNDWRTQVNPLTAKNDIPYAQTLLFFPRQDIFVSVYNFMFATEEIKKQSMLLVKTFSYQISVWICLNLGKTIHSLVKSLKN